MLVNYKQSSALCSSDSNGLPDARAHGRLKDEIAGVGLDCKLRQVQLLGHRDTAERHCHGCGSTQILRCPVDELVLFFDGKFVDLGCQAKHRDPGSACS